jgi:hypothetical protein
MVEATELMKEGKDDEEIKIDGETSEVKDMK